MRRHARPVDAHAWANWIRSDCPVLGAIRCSDPADVYDSEFRRWAGLQPVHLCQLRELARQQAHETRQAAA